MFFRSKDSETYLYFIILYYSKPILLLFSTIFKIDFFNFECHFVDLIISIRKTCFDLIFCFLFRNIVHGSDSVESANKEIALWFSEKELVQYSPNNEVWVYEK